MEIDIWKICFRGGKDREGEMRYNPFRITPYLLKVQGTGSSGEEEEACCLALSERIISGYEGGINDIRKCTQLNKQHFFDEIDTDVKNMFIILQNSYRR